MGRMHIVRRLRRILLCSLEYTAYIVMVIKTSLSNPRLQCLVGGGLATITVSPFPNFGLKDLSTAKRRYSVSSRSPSRKVEGVLAVVQPSAHLR